MTNQRATNEEKEQRINYAADQLAKGERSMVIVKKLAKRYKKWILIGSLIIKISKDKLVNRSVLIDKNGKIRSFYDKIHMYDVVLSKKEKYFESKTFNAGKNQKTFNLPWGKLGLSICYDLRFPNHYRKLSKATLSC